MFVRENRVAFGSSEVFLGIRDFSLKFPMPSVTPDHPYLAQKEKPSTKDREGFIGLLLHSHHLIAAILVIGAAAYFNLPISALPQLPFEREVAKK